MAVNLKQNPDGTTSLHSESLGQTVLLLGGQEQPVAGGGSIAYHGSSYLKATLTNLPQTAGVLSVQNPFGRDVIIGRTIIKVDTGFATTTAFLSFGTGAVAATHGSNLLDHATASGTDVLDNITNKGTLGRSNQLWASGTFITGTASVTPSTLTGTAYFEILNP